MATANKLSVPKPVNLPSMKKVRGATETRTANRMCAVSTEVLFFRETRAASLSVFPGVSRASAASRAPGAPA